MFKKIEVMIFDIGGVLIRLHALEAKRRLIENFGMSLECYTDLTKCTYTTLPRSVTELAVIGELNSESYLLAFKRGCKRPASLDEIMANRVSIIGEEIAEMVQLLRVCMKQYRVVAFTNTIDLHWKFILDSRRYSFLDSVDHVFASHLIGVAKPQKEAFRLVLDSIGIDASKALLIDDTEANIASARECGLQAFHFKTPQQFATFAKQLELSD